MWGGGGTWAGVGMGSEHGVEQGEQAVRVEGGGGSRACAPAPLPCWDSKKVMAELLDLKQP